MEFALIKKPGIYVCVYLYTVFIYNAFLSSHNRLLETNMNVPNSNTHNLKYLHIKRYII